MSFLSMGRCDKCGKKKFSRSLLSLDLGADVGKKKYCPKCFCVMATWKIDFLEGENEILRKRLKNKGARVWVPIYTYSGTDLYSGTIYNRTECECGVKFNDEKLLEYYDETADSITLFFPWEQINLTKEEGEEALEAIKEAERLRDEAEDHSALREPANG